MKMIIDYRGMLKSLSDNNPKWDKSFKCFIFWQSGSLMEMFYVIDERWLRCISDGYHNNAPVRAQPAVSAEDTFEKADEMSPEWPKTSLLKGSAVIKLSATSSLSRCDLKLMLDLLVVGRPRTKTPDHQASEIPSSSLGFHLARCGTIGVVFSSFLCFVVNAHVCVRCEEALFGNSLIVGCNYVCECAC